MQRNYEDEFKKKIIKLHLEEGRTLKSISEEYKVSRASISLWIKKYREECEINHDTEQEYNSMQEVNRLRKQLEEVKKENDFLKKAAAFFAKEID
jgi:transposase